MEKLMQITSYFDELKRVLGSVNRLVYSIDPLYVMYSWITQLFTSITAIAPFVIGVVGVGYLMQSAQLDKTVIVLAVAGFCGYLTLERLVRAWVEERQTVFHSLLSNCLKKKRVAHMATLDMGRMVDPLFIHLSQLAQNRGEPSVNALWQAQKDLLGSIVGFLFSLAALLLLDWIIGLLAFIVALPSITKRWLTEQKRRALDEAETIIFRHRNEAYDAISDPKMVVVTRSLNLLNSMVGWFSELTNVLVANVRLIARFERRWDIITAIVTMICFGTLVWYFAEGIFNERYGFTEIAIIIASVRIATFAVSEFGWSIGRIEQLRQDYKFLDTFFATKPLVDESQCRPLALKATPRLLFNDATFFYPSQEKPALCQISLVISQGQKTALVGPNGCGKTTLLRLLNRIYIASDGNILADFFPLDMVKQDSWVKHVVMSVQGAALPSTEIVRAITGGAFADADHRRLDRALELSNAKSIVDNLKLGLETWIGEEWPNGKGFSTGERQRLLLAATFYRLLDSNVFIGLFDEPTADCDHETKERFYWSLAHAPEFKEKTIVVSLHDPLYLHSFDRVVQFEAGRLINDLQDKESIEAYRSKISLALAQDL